MKPHDFQKYLRKNPAPQLNHTGFTRFVVIPVCDENGYIDATLAGLAAAPGIERTLVVLVINHPANASPERKAANAGLTARLEHGASPLPHLAYFTAFDLEGGVGRARKLGMDACLATLTPESVEQALFWSLDADSPVEPDYFTATEAEFEKHSEYAALSIRVRHQPGETPELERAIREYERYLGNYVERLRQAGSPYAFQTIGSAFAVRATAYLRAGGMRVREGGEDFYFLQAVAKTGKVGTLGRALVHPSPRPSDRVPFGTGPSVRKLLEGGAVPEIPDTPFDGLKTLLAAAARPGALEEPAKFLAGLPAPIRQFLTQNKFAANWPQVLANTPATGEARLAAFHQWFDGLKTLRLLHSLSDNR